MSDLRVEPHASDRFVLSTVLHADQVRSSPFLNDRIHSFCMFGAPAPCQALFEPGDIAENKTVKAFLSGSLYPGAK